MRRVFLVLSLLLCLLLPAASLAEGDTASEENLLYNSDFSLTAASETLPAGWELVTYIEDDAAAAVELCDADGTAYVKITNFVSNDTRLVQSVAVQPETVYRIRANVCTESVRGELGATVSIDNYSVDGVYCYSEPVFGTTDWQRITLYVKTAPGQDSLRVALRLGGYGQQAAGSASFSGVDMRKADAPEDGELILLEEAKGVTAGASGETAQTAADDDGAAALIWMLVVTIAVAALYSILHGRVFRYEADMLLTPAHPHMELYVILAGALLLRVILSLVFVGHSTDLNCFMAWGNAMLNGGPAAFYTSGMFADYPPGYMYILWLMAWIGKTLGLSYGSAGYVLLFKLPATIADLAAGYFIYRLARKQGISEAFALILAGLFAINPAGMYISGAWGQIDSLLSLLLVLACYLFCTEKRILAGAVYGLAILMKPQALMLGPLLAVAYVYGIFGPQWKKRLADTLLAVCAAVAVILALSYPFRSTQAWDWLIQKYVSTAGSYAYASIEAFNVPALLGANWAPVTRTVLGISFRAWGTVFIVLAVALSGLAYCRSAKTRPGALYLSGAFMIAMIFTFGHYMHERYLFPVLLLLLMAYLLERDRRILLCFGGFTVSILLNVLAAMYIVDHRNARGSLYNAVTRAGAALELLVFLYLAYVTFQILIRNRIVLPEKTPKRKAAESSAPRMILPDGPGEHRLRYTKRDRVILGALVFVYGIVALTNLGTLNAPETYWQTETLGETVTVAFDGEREVSEYWVYCNIGDPATNHSGTMLLRAGDFETTYEQIYDNMFRWQRFDAAFTADRVELTLYSGRLKLNEIAFIDAEGKPIPAHVVEPEGSQAALLDEQDTVPERPSYYNGMYFDELYHARTAYEHLHNLRPYENSHPPLGKLLIMLGVAVFGMNPFGWRIVGALFGIAMLPVLYAFGKRMLKNTNYAFLLTALFAFDFMHFTQTRIATIDVYAVFFILLMYYYMYEYIQMNFFTDGLSKTLRPLALSGVFFGVGAASKWICFYAGAGLAVLFFVSLGTRYREYSEALADGTKSERKATGVFFQYALKTLLWCVLFFIIVPVTIYFLSYTPYYIYEAGQRTGSYGLSDMVKTCWSYQDFMFSYHSGLNATHPYQSSWWQWPFTLRPMWYAFSSSANGQISTLTASGNPAVWWVSTIGAIVLLMQRCSGKIKPDRALQVICVGVLANYLPWVLVPRCTFIYHFFATVPFLLMATVYALAKWEEREPRIKWVKWVWLGVAILLFVLLYPGISGLWIPRSWALILKKLPGGALMYGA